MPQFKKPRIVRRREIPLKFKEDYFGREEKANFSSSFLARSAFERHGMLTKHQRKVRQTLSFLHNSLSFFNRQSDALKEKGKSGINLEKLERKWEDSRKAYLGILRDARKFFSEKYIQKIGWGKGKLAFNQHLGEFHFCIGLWVEIDGFWKHQFMLLKRIR